MESVKVLIDRAAGLCGSKRALAYQLGLTEQNLQGVYAGRRHLNIRQAGELAHIVGLDPKAVWAEVGIEKEADEETRKVLSRSFFGGLVAVFLGFCLGYPSEVAAKTALDSQHLTASHCLTHYTLSRTRMRAQGGGHL